MIFLDFFFFFQLSARTQSNAFVLPTRAARDRVWNTFDVNGNNKLSLAEVDKAVVELWPQFNHKPALIRAFHAADKDNSGFINRREFRLLLAYTVYFTNVWSIFAEIDDGDRRLSREEFGRACQRLGLNLSHDQVDREFRDADRDGGGMVLFVEFCSWIARKHIPVPEDD
eukprot:gnl/Hemi2/16522_TR5525_c0_g1_i2.p1 gnl/Hemi2/16522_TR5525_c0_g1~~gnl/Hemi2/16522_TR5525_c0_g1_i2.p1  ORF type:complete len:170 (-),score=54.39 gnl/Hemi2/16522_TR5525_c0_g1_i2:108-617(-)